MFILQNYTCPKYVEMLNPLQYKYLNHNIITIIIYYYCVFHKLFKCFIVKTDTQTGCLRLK
jgi:hypothetical protein